MGGPGDRKDDILGNERLSVGELDTRADVEGPILSVGADSVPAREPGHELSGDARDVERLEDLVQGVDVAADDRVRGVELGRAGFAAEVQRPSSHGRRRMTPYESWRGSKRTDERDGRGRAEHTTTEQLPPRDHASRRIPFPTVALIHRCPLVLLACNSRAAANSSSPQTTGAPRRPEPILPAFPPPWVGSSKARSGCAKRSATLNAPRSQETCSSNEPTPGGPANGSTV